MKIQYIENTFAEKILLTMEGFFTQLDGSPRLLYLMNLYKALLEDQTDETLDKTKINEVYSNFLMNAYNELTGIESLTKIAFDDIDDRIVEIEEIVQKPHYDIAAKYDIQLTDSVGNPIDINDAKALRDKFFGLEQNYKLHGDYLFFVYQELRQMDNEFKVMEYESLIKPTEEE